MKPYPSLHHLMTRPTSQSLPLPFLITGSGCVQWKFQKTLSESAVSFEIKIESPPCTLAFDLDLRNGILRRIICLVYHPMAAFLSCKADRLRMGSRVDAGMNFFLRLLGKSHNSEYFVNEYLEGRTVSTRHLPIRKRPRSTNPIVDVNK